MTVTVDAEVGRGTFQLRLATRLAEPTTGVYGPSGAGKTTFLHLLAGLIRPARGVVALDGEILDDTQAGIHVPAYKRRIGLVFQHGHLFPHLSVAGNLHYGERLQPPEGKRISFSALVDLLDIGPLLQRRPAGLSGGERQRVALGRALLASPRLMLFDEPLAALDQGLKRQILPYLRRITGDLRIPFIYVSHDLGEVLRVTDDLLLLDRGLLVARGPYPRITGGGEATALRGTITRHDASTALTTITLANGLELRATLREDPPGTPCTVLIRSEEVIVTTAVRDP